MTQQDARERAFQAYKESRSLSEIISRPYPSFVDFCAGTDWQKREDEQRIAALVAAAERFKAANDALTELHEREAINSTKTDAEWAGLVSDAWFEHDRARDALYAALRALGQSEEVSDA